MAEEVVSGRGSYRIMVRLHSSGRLVESMAHMAREWGRA